jgi:hypothetical protein
VDGRHTLADLAAVSFSAPLMSTATTDAPSRTKTFVDALAIPDPAPVMSATFPCRSDMEADRST